MKVLLVNQHTVPIFTDIANAFAESRQHTVLFTGHIEKGAHPLSSAIVLTNSVRYSRRTTVTRLFTWLAFTVHYAFHLLFCRKPEVILVTTNPPLAPIITAAIARVRKLRYQVLLYDLYPDALFQAGLVQRRNPILKIWQRINPWVFNGADKIFTLSESMRHAASQYVTTGRKLKVVYNWADASYLRPVLRTENKFVRQHGLHDKFVVLYAGNMGLTHDLESLIEAADLLKQKSRLQFVLIGNGGKKKRLQAMAKKKGLQNVLFLPYQDEETFPFAMASADVGVVTLGYGAEGISVPSKTYVNLASGACLLTIAPANSELNRLIEEFGAGVVCAPGQPTEVANHIRRLAENPDMLNDYKKKALMAATFFTPRNAYEYVAESKVSSAVIA